MASQSSDSIELFYDYKQQGLRLLELPPEVSAALDAPNPPSLELKSSDHGNAALALCTIDKTYEVKQISSSNSVMLVQPMRMSKGTEHTTSLVAFAKCASVLEALPLSAAPGKARTAKAYLTELLPVYDHTTHGTHPAGRAVSRSAVDSSIPYSDSEISLAWTDLIAFEVEMGCFRPSVATCLALWSSLLTSTTAQGIDLTTQIAFNELHAYVPEFPQPLFASLVRRMASSPTNSTVRLDSGSVAATLASLLLRRHPSAHLQTTLEDLRALLPEKWRSKATAELLSSLPESTPSGASGSGSVQMPDQKRKAASASRNWHDKFRRPKT